MPLFFLLKIKKGVEHCNVVYIESVRNWQSIYYYVRLDMVFNSLMKFFAYENKDIVFNSEYLFCIVFPYAICYQLEIFLN